MSDERIQELERAWRASGAVEDGARWLRERVRAGLLSGRAVRLASYLGSEVAVAALGRATQRPSALQRASSRSWIEGMLELARDTAWRGELLRRVQRQGVALGLPAWTLRVRRREELPPGAEALLLRVAQACAGLPAPASVEAAQAALVALDEQLGAAVRAHESGRPEELTSDDPEEDDIMRHHWTEDSPAYLLSISTSNRRTELKRLGEKSVSDPRHATEVFESMHLDEVDERACRTALAAALIDWLIGPDGPASSGPSELGELEPEPPAMDDAALVAALQALALRSPVKRMLVEDLARTLKTGGALREGQRERAHALLREQGGTAKG